MGSKTNLFSHICGVKKPTIEPNKKIDDLKKEAEVTQGSNAKKYKEDEVTKIDFDFSKIENNIIFSEVIVGNENSVVAGFIKELGTADWVKQGMAYLSEPKEKNEKCPFCQQETITQYLHSQIKNYFDSSYQERLDQLQSFEKQYDEAIKQIPAQEKFLENVFIKNSEKDFKLFYKNLTTKLNNNLKFIINKKNRPSEIISLESTKTEIKALNIFFDKIIVEIKAHNLKIDNKEKTKNSLKNSFWQIMRFEYDQTIENFNIQKDSIDKIIVDTNESIKALGVTKNIQRKVIGDAQKEIVNIDEAIKNINYALRDLGASGFQIEKVDDKFYQIKRERGSKNQFKSLSEGEKTIISFLYFLELCKGKESEDEVVISKIVVIDDPVSSLSHVYIFNISQLINWHFFKKLEFKQIFVLTHSLYFFHELLNKSYNIGKEKKLFRIAKLSNNNSTILDLKQNEIQNDYQSYWQIIKDHNQGISSDASLANAMRNILEHFFGFIEKDKFSDSIEQLDQQKYQAFIRYINRESHSDFTNISDTKEIDVNMFKLAFEEVFEKSGHQNHYNKMINNL